MTRARHVIPSRTAERLERMRSLIIALQARQLRRDEVGALLKVGPSGVRKYLSDMRAQVEQAYEAGEQVCRLAMDAAATSAYLADLATQAAARRPSRPLTPMELAIQDPSRHIHIMLDDEDFKVRMHRGIPVHEPVLAHFFNLVPSQAWA